MDKLSQLKDIKPIVDIPNSDLHILIAIVSFLLLLIIVGLYKYFTRIKKPKKATPKQLALKRFKNLDYDDTKEVVYCFSVDGSLFLTEQNKDQFKTIEKELEQYKYKKDVDPLTNEIKSKIKIFLKGLK